MLDLDYCTVPECNNNAMPDSIYCYQHQRKGNNKMTIQEINSIAYLCKRIIKLVDNIELERNKKEYLKNEVYNEYNRCLEDIIRLRGEK